MFELIYPYETVPVLPHRKAGDNHDEEGGKQEMFPVIEPSGLVTAMASRAFCHSGAKVLHPVVHLHILDRYSRLYLQKRSMSKDIQPGKWDTAVGGHVDFGEQLHEALYREASEELGLREFNPIYIGTYEFESEVERESVNIFAIIGSYDLHPDEQEVEEGRFWDINEIDESLGKSLFTPNFEAEYAKIRNTLLSLL